MANWAGFSEEDLKKLNAPNGNGQKVQRKPQSKARPQRAVQPMKKQTRDVSQSVPLSQSSDLPAAARLSHAAPSTQQEVRHDGAGIPANHSNKTDTPVRHAEEVEVNIAAPAAEAAVPVLQPQVSAEVLTEDDGRNRDLTNLQQYQQQQKMMEELNKKKKQMLAEALVQRQKQANVEAKKLNAIKKELSALDQMLTADVSLIRDRIEEATREYADANKRYELAEKEYIASKMNLHKKSELKEQLTEHLYTIIHQNEVRKAKKLADLMDALNLATEECDTENNSTLPDLPSFSLLGNMQTMASGNLVQHTTPVTSPQTDAPTTTPAATPPTATPQTEAVTLPATDIANTNNIQSDNSSSTTSATPEISSNEVTSDKPDKAKTDIESTEGNSKHIESSDSSRNATPNAGVLSDDDLK